MCYVGPELVAVHGAWFGTHILTGPPPLVATEQLSLGNASRVSSLCH